MSGASEDAITKLEAEHTPDSIDPPSNRGIAPETGRHNTPTKRSRQITLLGITYYHSAACLV